MRKFLLIALAALAVLLGGFAGVVAMQPADYRVARNATIAAPVTVVFPFVNDFHNWEGWSPWARLDPDAKIKFDGPAWGPGAKFAWSGNDKVGEGRMTLEESRAGEKVRIRLEFVKPMAGEATSEFMFTDDRGRTAVSWSIHGRNGFVARAFCLFVDMDKMLGGELEKGLAQLKSVSEAAAQVKR